MNKLKFYFVFSLLFFALVEAQNVDDDVDSGVNADVQEIEPSDMDEERSAGVFQIVSKDLLDQIIRRQSRENVVFRKIDNNGNNNSVNNMSDDENEAQQRSDDTDDESDVPVEARFYKWHKKIVSSPVVYKYSPPPQHVTVVVHKRKYKKGKKKYKKDKGEKKDKHKHKHKHKHKDEENNYHDIFSEPFTSITEADEDVLPFNRYPYIADDYGYPLRRPQPPRLPPTSLPPSPISTFNDYRGGPGGYGGGYNRYSLYSDFSRDPFLDYNNRLAAIDSIRYRNALRKRLLLRQIKRAQMVGQRRPYRRRPSRFWTT